MNVDAFSVLFFFLLSNNKNDSEMNADECISFQIERRHTLCIDSFMAQHTTDTTRTVNKVSKTVIRVSTKDFSTRSIDSSGDSGTGAAALFDILDDDRDELHYSTEELNRYFEEGHLRSTMMEEDEMVDEASLGEMQDTVVGPSVRRSSHHYLFSFYLVATRRRRRRRSSLSAVQSVVDASGRCL